MIHTFQGLKLQYQAIISSNILFTIHTDIHSISKLCTFSVQLQGRSISSLPA